MIAGHGGLLSLLKEVDMDVTTVEASPERTTLPGCACKLIGCWQVIVMLVELVVFGAVVAVGGGSLLVASRMKGRSVARCKIRDAVDGGLVRIVGEVEKEHETVRAPLSGRDVLAYEVCVEVHANRFWQTLHRENKAVPLLLRDDSGAIRIDPGAAKIVLDRRTAHDCGHLEDLGELDGAFLRSRNIERTSWLGLNRKLRLTEWTLEQGDTMAAIGTACWELDPAGDQHVEPGYRDTCKRLRVIASASGSVLLTTRPERFGE